MDYDKDYVAPAQWYHDKVVVKQRGRSRSNKQNTVDICKARDKFLHTIDTKPIMTINALSARMYKSQKTSSIRRKHVPPAYTLAEYRVWLFNNNYEELYDNWVASGCSKKVIPSCDRLNPMKPYTMDNIRLVTWQDNSQANYDYISNRIINK